MNYELLRDLIEKVKEIYGVPIIGLVSDKQGLIVKCRDVFYPDIPHQYCQFHFLKNQWKHLSIFDGKVFSVLKKAIKMQYIMKTSRTALVNFQDRGILSVREVFAPVEADFKRMIRATNKTFKMLKGIWLYEALDEYIAMIEADLPEMDNNLRFTKISTKLASSLRAALNSVKKDYGDTIVMMEYFQQIRKAFGEAELEEDEIDEIYENIWEEIVAKEPNLKKELLRTFMPKKIHTAIESMGEWVRLWGSYRRGLFEYKKFPIPAKTNNLLEQTFSKQKYRLRKRGGKGNVYGLVNTEGELYLRLVCCTKEELDTDIKEDYLKANLYELQSNLDESKHAESSRWWTGSEILLGWIDTHRREL